MPKCNKITLDGLNRKNNDLRCHEFAKCNALHKDEKLFEIGFKCANRLNEIEQDDYGLIQCD